MTKLQAIDYLETDISRLGNTPQNISHKEALQLGINALLAWSEIADDLTNELNAQTGNNEYIMGIQVGLSKALVLVSKKLLDIQGIKS